MALVKRLAVVVLVTGWILAIPASASAKMPPLAGGGGHGGACFEPPPALDYGWVAVGDNCFSPRMTDVATGESVRWSLEGQISHTVTFDGGPDAGTLTGDGFAITFRAPGTYEYFCSFHPGMAGTIRAVGNTLSGPALEVLGMPSAVAASGGTTANTGTSVLRDSVPMRVEFSPLAATVVLAVGLPLSLGLAARLVGVARSPAGFRLRAPWEPKPPRRPAARR